MSVTIRHWSGILLEEEEDLVHKFEERKWEAFRLKVKCPGFVEKGEEGLLAM